MEPDRLIEVGKTYEELLEDSKFLNAVFNGTDVTNTAILTEENTNHLLLGWNSSATFTVEGDAIKNIRVDNWKTNSKEEYCQVKSIITRGVNSCTFLLLHYVDNNIDKYVVSHLDTDYIENFLENYAIKVINEESRKMKDMIIYEDTIISKFNGGTENGFTKNFKNAKIFDRGNLKTPSRTVHFEIGVYLENGKPNIFGDIIEVVGANYKIFTFKDFFDKLTKVKKNQVNNLL